MPIEKLKARESRQRKLSGGFVPVSHKWLKRMRAGSEADREFADRVTQFNVTAEKLDAYQMMNDKYNIHPVVSLKIENEVDVDLNDIGSVQKIGDDELYIEARQSSGYYKGFSLFQSDESAYDRALETQKNLLDELEWVDSADSLDGFDSMGVTDIRILAGELADSDVQDRNRKDLMQMVRDLPINTNDAEKWDTDKLRQEVSDKLYWKHKEALEDRPLKYIVDEQQTHTLDDAISSNIIDIDVEAMARQEIDSQGVAQILSEGGNQESILNPNTESYLELFW